MSGAARQRAASSASVPPSRPVCVTGASGFVGSHIIRELCDRSVPCRALTREKGARDACEQHLGAIKRAEMSARQERLGASGSKGKEKITATDGDGKSNGDDADDDENDDAKATGAGSDSDSSSSSPSGSEKKKSEMGVTTPAGRVSVAERIPEPSEVVEKYLHLLEMNNPEAGATVSVMHGDPADRASLEEAFRGCESVIHCAANVTRSESNPIESIIQAAVFGTQNALEAAVRCGVRRFVHISCVDAVSPNDGGKSGRGTNPERSRLTEDDWFEGTIETHGSENPYAVAKALSEKLLSQYRDRIDVVISLCPSLVLGPLLSPCHVQTSPRVIGQVMAAGAMGLPRLSHAVVDARDVAQAAVDCAVGVRGSPAGRYILSNGTWSLVEIAQALQPYYPQVQTRRMWDWLALAGAAVDPERPVGALRKRLGLVEYYDSSRAASELGIRFIDPVKTFHDTARSLVEMGLADDQYAPVDSQWEDDRT